MSTPFRKAHLGLAAGLFGVVATGCGSGSTAEPYPDAHPFDTGTGTASGGSTGTGGATTDGGAADAGKPDPVSGEGNVRIFSGASAVQFLTRGPTCTAEAGSTADRWCAFLATSSTNPANIDLFVINVSRAAAGAPIACGGVTPDPNCLRLTRGFFEESSSPAPHAAYFQGDTLVFFDLFGTPYGWRPGMLDARILSPSSGGDVHNCFPAPKGNAVMCLRDLPDTEGTGLIISDLLLGRLDAKADPPLTRVESVITNNPIDGLGAQRFQYGWVTPAGDTLAWSSRQSVAGPEVLRVRKVDDAASVRTIASDVTRWSASADGKRWYWLANWTRQTNFFTGELQTATLPDGTDVTPMIRNVVDYEPSPGGAVVVLTGELELKSVGNPAAAPSVITSLATGVKGLVAVGAEHVAYLRSFDPIFPISDAYTTRLDGTQMDPCTLTGQTDGIRYGLHFLPDSSGLLWARVTSLNVPVGDLPPIDAIVTNLTTCSRAIVGSKVGDGDWDLAAASGILYIDQTDGFEGTLRLRKFTSPPTLDTAPPTMINTRVNAFMPVFPVPGVVLFTVNADSAKDGLYLNVAKGGQTSADGGTD